MRTLKYRASTTPVIEPVPILFEDRFDVDGPVDADNWTMLTNSPQITVVDGRALIDNNTGMYHLPTAVIQSRPQSITVEMSETNNVAMFVYATDSITGLFPYNCYYLVPDDAGNLLNLLKRVNGSGTLLQSFATPFADGDICTLTASAGVISVGLNGTEVITVNDATHTSGFAGVFTVWESANINQYVDNITIEATVDLEVRAETDTIDLFESNLSVRRFDSRTPLAKFGIFNPGDNLNNLALVSSALLTDWSDLSSEEKSIIGVLAPSCDIYLSVIDDLASTITNALSLGVAGVYIEDTIDSERDDLVAAGLKLATLTGSISAHDLRASLVIHKVDLTVTPSDQDVIDATYAFAMEAYQSSVEFYYNTDPRHLPGEWSGNWPQEFTIPTGTIVSVTDGPRFMVVDRELPNTTIVDTPGYMTLTAIPLDGFVSIEEFEIDATNLNIQNIYVTNRKRIESAHLVVMDENDDIFNTRLSSLAYGIASHATSYVTQGDDPRSYEPGVYIGERASEIDLRNGYVFTTDIGTVYIENDIISVKNELTSVEDHLTDAVQYRTGDTEADVLTQRWIDIDHNAKFQRYVQLSGTGDVEVTVVLTDEGDRIPYDETIRMVDQLPLWMSWKEVGSVGFEMNNIVGRHIAEIFSAGGLLAAYQLEDLDDRVNGVVDVYDVPSDYVPNTADVLVQYDIDTYQMAIASDPYELLNARIPCFYVSDSKMYLTRHKAYTIDQSVDASNRSIENLWTAFDEWGLMFNLTRHQGESVERFRKRILDIFISGFGSNKEGLVASAIRELSPPIDNTFETAVPMVMVHDLTEASMKDVDGFPVDDLINSVKLQRSHGVHTWGNAIAGRAIFDADGPDHIAQDRLPYVYDTDITNERLLGGTGPGNDIKIERAEADLITPAVTMTRAGTLDVPVYSGKRLDILVAFKGKGSMKRMALTPVDYSVKVSVTISGTTYYRYIKGTQTSNVNPNAATGQIGEESTSTHSYNFLPYRRDGLLSLEGSWFTSGDVPAKPPLAAWTTQVTNVTVDNLSSPQASTRYWIEYTHSSTHAFTMTAKTTNQLVVTSSTALQSKSGLTLKVQVAPFSIITGDGGSVGVSVADYETPVVYRNVTLYGTLSSGDLSGTSTVIDRPKFLIPSYVTGVTYEASIVEVSPMDNSSRAEGDPSAISTATMTDLAVCTSISTVGTVEADGNYARYSVLFDPSKATLSTSFPYPRPISQKVYSNRTIHVSDLANGETRTIKLKSSQIPTLPAGSTETGLTVLSSDPGVIASLSGANLSVTRTDNRNITRLLARSGYYWIDGEEKFLYSGGANGTEVTWVLASGTYTYRTLPKRPAPFSLVRCFVNNMEFTYQFYDGGNGTKTFAPDGLPPYANSFYIDEQRIVFSETLTGPVTIKVYVEGDDASGFTDTGISMSPFMSWDDSFFIELNDGTAPIPHIVELTCDRPVIYNDRGAFGCSDVALVSALVLDSDGNPVAGEIVTWSTSSGNLIGTSNPSITSADGRATAYYSSTAAGIATITATAGGIISWTTVTSIGTSAGSVQTLSATMKSMVQSGTDQVIEFMFSDGGTSYPSKLYLLPCPGTENIEGTWKETAVVWGTTTAYVIGDRVSTGGKEYICVVDHTSGTFANDLAALKWIVSSADIIAVNGKAKWTQLMNIEGLYKLTISPNMTLVWRVY